MTPDPRCPAAPTVSERLLLSALRKWAAMRIRGAQPERPVRFAVAAASSQRCGALFVAFMQALEQAARRPIQIHCPHCDGASLDEQRLIVAFGLAPTAFEVSEAMLQPMVADPQPLVVLARTLGAALAAEGMPLPSRLMTEPVEHSPAPPTLH